MRRAAPPCVSSIVPPPLPPAAPASHRPSPSTHPSLKDLHHIGHEVHGERRDRILAAEVRDLVAHRLDGLGRLHRVFRAGHVAAPRAGFVAVVL